MFRRTNGSDELCRDSRSRPDVPPHERQRRALQGLEIAPTEADRARLRAKHAGRDGEQRGLARAAPAAHHDHLPARHRQGDVIEDARFRAAELDSFEADHAHARRPRPRTGRSRRAIWRASARSADRRERIVDASMTPTARMTASAGARGTFMMRAPGQGVGHARCPSDAP
jgi:hypothetical protein